MALPDPNSLGSRSYELPPTSPDQLDLVNAALQRLRTNPPLAGGTPAFFGAGQGSIFGAPQLAGGAPTSFGEAPPGPPDFGPNVDFPGVGGPGYRQEISPSPVVGPIVSPSPVRTIQPVTPGVNRLNLPLPIASTPLAPRAGNTRQLGGPEIQRAAQRRMLAGFGG